ncbi:MAG: J domain-containing protein [Mycobacterium sp.]
MTENHNPYVVLGVTSHASLADINRAFRTKLRALHPDTRHPGRGGTTSDTQLQQLIDAFHLLRNPEDRAQHDRSVAAATTPPQSRPVSASPDEPLTIPVVYHRYRTPAEDNPLWAGPVRRHR